MTVVDLSPPTPIGLGHDLSVFESAEPSLDEWLKKRALKNHASGASRCFVLCAGVAVVGYYSLSAGAISHEAAPKAMRRNMPDPLLLLGRLAIVVHALPPEAKQFYLSRGFVQSPLQPMTLIMTLKTVRSILTEA